MFTIFTKIAKYRICRINGLSLLKNMLYSREWQMFRSLGFLLVDRFLVDYSQTIKLRITLSLTIVLQNQLNIRFSDVTLDIYQKYFLHTDLNYEIIYLSFLTQFSLSL